MESYLSSILCGLLVAVIYDIVRSHRQLILKTISKWLTQEMSWGLEPLELHTHWPGQKSAPLVTFCGEKQFGYLYATPKGQRKKAPAVWLRFRNDRATINVKALELMAANQTTSEPQPDRT